MLFKPTIVLSGGIGNQLFQWAAAHILFKETVFKLNLSHYEDNPERDFELDPILFSCTHYTDSALHLARTPLTKYFEWAAAKGASPSLLEPLGFFQEQSFNAKTIKRLHRKIDLGTPVIVEGLFHDIRIVEDAWPLMGTELTAAITVSFESTKTKLVLPDNYAAFHVRRGDYPISITASDAIGQLDDEYFIACAREIDLPIILLTENANEVANLNEALSGSRIISRAEANPLQTLAILRNAELLVGSNSSLSWWGAYLAAKTGKESYLPKDWSQWNNFENSNLKYPLINLLPSIWKLPNKN